MSRTRQRIEDRKLIFECESYEATEKIGSQLGCASVLAEDIGNLRGVGCASHLVELIGRSVDWLQLRAFVRQLDPVC